MALLGKGFAGYSCLKTGRHMRRLSLLHNVKRNGGLVLRDSTYAHRYLCLVIEILTGYARESPLVKLHLKR